MSTPLFTVAVRDLDSGPQIVKGPLPHEFLTRLLAETDVEPHGDGVGEVSFTIENTDPQILVRGRLDVTVAVPCARTLDPAVYRLQPEVFLLLSPAGGEHAKPSGPQRRGRPERSAEKLAQVEEKRAAAGKKGAARSSSGVKPPARANAKPKGAWDDDPELGEQDAAFDTYSGDQVVLDGFIREFILLEIPMVPLREDLRSDSFEASPPPPSADPTADGNARAALDKPLDPRLSPLAELKARLEQKKE